jgi:toxin ParE1/3/4
MTLKVVVLRSAESDLMELKRYLRQNFGLGTWRESYRGIKDAIVVIQSFPHRGRVPDELANIGLTQFREVTSGMNRIIYEVRDDTIYLHLVCDVRRDLKPLLARRLWRTL